MLEEMVRESIIKLNLKRESEGLVQSPFPQRNPKTPRTEPHPTLRFESSTLSTKKVLHF